jgi:hypothetical protein
MALLEINWKPQRQQLRTFGLVGCAAFLFLGTWAWYRHRVLGMHLAPSNAVALAWVLWIVGVACGVLALVAPPLLRPLYVALTAITLPIGFVVSHVIMGILYFGVFTPVGLLFRLMGRDPLNRRLEPAASSYWLPREQVTDVERYFRQY